MKLFNENFSETNLNYYKDRENIPCSESDIAIGLIELIMDIYNRDFKCLDKFSYYELKYAVYFNLEKLKPAELFSVIGYYKLKDHHYYFGEYTDFGFSHSSYRYYLSSALHKLYHSSIYQLLFGESLLLEENKESLECSNDIDNILIDNMDFSKYVWRQLKRAGIYTLADLADKTYDDLFKIKCIGKQSADEIVNKLNEYGIHISI